MFVKCLVVVVWSVICVANGQIGTSGPKCGQRQCSVAEYCSSIDYTCAPCSVACNKSSHNYEEITCQKECQDYLRDLRDSQYARRDTVDRLSAMVTVTLILVCFMLVVLVSLICFLLYRWKEKKNITLDSFKRKIFGTKSSQDNNSSTPARTNTAGKKGDLRLEMPTPTVQSEHSPVTVTTSISRRPAEDSTLDYAYDNPAMTSSR